MDGYSEGELVLDLPLIPSGLPRLRHIASSYQRIRWKKLAIRFEPMVPTLAAGGYVCGFVPDPDDDLSRGEALDRLLAHSGSKMSKVWQAQTVIHKCTGDLLFTSAPPKGETRLYSPGRVALIVDSKVSAGKNVACPLSVYIDWEVSLMEPSLEADATRAGLVEAKESFYTRSSNVGLYWKDATGGDDPRPVMPGIEFGVVYRLGSKRFVDLGSEGDRIAINFDRVVLVNHATHGITLAPCKYDRTPIYLQSSYNIYVIEKGDILVPEAGNALTGLNLLQSRRCFEELRPRQSDSKEPSSPSDSFCIV